jgi:hypothetical protein
LQLSAVAPVSQQNEKSDSRRGVWLLALVLVLAAAAHLWGIRKDLPWAYDSDEGKFTLIAVKMAKAGDPDPGWFGHPGSTVLYPQALAVQIADAARTGRSWLEVDAGLFDRFARDPSTALLLGRLISVTYAISALVLVFGLGNRAFGPGVGIVGAWLALLSPLALDHAQMVRTDSAGVFFGCLGLWLCLGLLERPTLRAHLATGVAIGFGIGTRYFLITLVGVMVAVDAIHLFRARSAPERRAILSAAAAGLAAVIGGFLLSTPYFLVELTTVGKNLAHEARESHLGQDNLGFLGNLAFYVGEAGRGQLGGAEQVLVCVGIAWALWRWRPGPLLLLGFVLVYLVGISLSALHWERWLIQIRPLLVLFAAAATVWGVEAAAERLGWTRRGRGRRARSRGRRRLGGTGGAVRGGEPGAGAAEHADRGSRVDPRESAGLGSARSGDLHRSARPDARPRRLPVRARRGACRPPRPTDGRATTTSWSRARSTVATSERRSSSRPRWASTALSSATESSSRPSRLRRAVADLSSGSTGLRPPPAPP